MKDNIKVLHIIDSLGLGGAQTILKGIFEKQQDTHMFLYGLRKKDITIEINHPNIQIYASKNKYSLGSIFKLKKLIKKEKINILHCHLFKAQVFGWLIKKLWFKDITLIFHEHGGIIEDGSVYRLFLNKTQKSVNVFIAVSKAMEEALINNAHIDIKKITVIYNFVNIDKFSKNNITWDIEQEKQKIGIQQNEFVVGFAGRLIERKGWKDFIETASLVSKTESNIKFLLAGDGPQKPEMLSLINDSGLNDKIIYLGYVSDMVKFYSLLDIFVMSSHWEGLPMAQLEVLAMGTPLITSNAMGMNEIAKDKESCLYSIVKNPEDISKCISLLINDINLRQTLKTNAPLIAEKYSLVVFLNNLNKCYNNLVQ